MSGDHVKLRFSVRGGKGRPDYLVTIEVRREDIAADVGELLAQRLIDGIDVCYGGMASKGKIVPGVYGDVTSLKPFNIQADHPTWESLVEALRRDDQLLKDELDRGIQGLIGPG